MRLKKKDYKAAEWTRLASERMSAAAFHRHVARLTGREVRTPLPDAFGDVIGDKAIADHFASHLEHVSSATDPDIEEQHRLAFAAKVHGVDNDVDVVVKWTTMI